MANNRLENENYVPLRVPEATVKKHWGLLQGKLNELLPKVGGKYNIEPAAPRGAVGNLTCSEFRREVAYRERGISTPVVPLLETARADVRFWLSLYQDWREDRTPRSQKLIYHTTGLTIFFGDIESADKLQLFRAEWAGVRMQSEGVFIFEAKGAGHPHWQFDVYESRASEVEDERKRLEELGRTLDEIREVEEFSEIIVKELSPEIVISRNVCMQRLSRIHFASSTNWAKLPWNGNRDTTQAHAQGPANISELQNWVTSTIIYITQEISR